MINLNEYMFELRRKHKRSQIKDERLLTAREDRFKRLDVNEDGRLDTSEVRETAMAHAPVKQIEKDVYRLFYDADVDRDKYLSREEIISKVRKDEL